MYDILTLENASKLLGISERTLADKARAGEVPAHKVFGRWLFLHSELVAFIASHPAKEHAKERVKEQKLDKSLGLSKAQTSGGNTYTRAANNYPAIVKALQEGGTRAEVAKEAGVSEALVKKVKRGAVELGLLN